MENDGKQKLFSAVRRAACFMLVGVWVLLPARITIQGQNTAPAQTPAYARIAFTGDLMVHEQQLETAYQQETDSYSFSGFSEIASYLRQADYTVGNLETTFASQEAGYGTYPLFNTPNAFADEIRDAGFDFVSTANNHCYDKRESGLLRTLEMLDARGIAHAGTYASQEDQNEIFMEEINGIRFAFLSYTYSTNGIPVAADKPWLVNMLDETLMRGHIQQARRGGADVVVVLPHMGDEYAMQPAERYVTLARNLCQWGADAVMANHPHVLQPTEFYTVTDENGQSRQCFIAYSMGNFISGQRTTPRDAGSIFYLEYIKGARGTRLVNVSCLPTWVKYVDSAGQYDIKVLSVYDALNEIDVNHHNIRPRDIERLKDVHRETTQQLLGREKPLEEIKRTYLIVPRPAPDPAE